jgi:HEPN domain-containing protein
LDEHKDQIPGDTRPFALNAALSIELILKSILARKNIGIPQGSDGHDLIVLSEKVGTTLTESQRLTLELLTETIVWSGRYPAPKKEQRWDDYHDRILESHIVRNKSGNKSSAMANRDTFPNWETYARIWNACVSEFEAAA